MKKTIYLIDGTAYIHRAYHAIRSLSNSRGLPTNAVFGFTRMILKLMEDKAPERAAVLFDAKGPTFRHEIYNKYKANRPPMPEDMAVQIPWILKVCEGFGLPVFRQPGVEADDLIGTLAKNARAAGFFVVMVTGDKDFVQLVDADAIIWDPMKDRIIDLAEVEKGRGVAPARMVDVMGLWGDTSDNIPGVPGVGEKTALALIKEFGSLEGVYEGLDTIGKKKLRENLAAHREQAFLSRELATIRTDIKLPEGFAPEELRLPGPDDGRLAELFGELEFRQLQRDFPKQTEKAAVDYKTVLDPVDLDALVKILSESGEFAVDTETTSQDPMRAALVGLSFAVSPHAAWYVPCGHRYIGCPDQIPMDRALSALKPALENPNIAKIGQNIKYDWIVLARHGVRLAGVRFDTMIASYLLNPTKRAHNLDQIALDFLNHKTTTYAEVAGSGKKMIPFSEVAVEAAAPYACEDADVTLRAARILEKAVADIGLSELMETVEMPLLPVLMNMEMRGIRVDRNRLRDLSAAFASELCRLEEAIHREAGEVFNINSSQQLGKILFEKLDLPVGKKTKKKTGYSTDVEVLTALAPLHDLPAMVLRHRSLAKLKSTYTDALLELIHPETGRIHTSFNQTVTATGRLSSSDPNLQNIPIREAEGRQIRSAFIPRQGWRLISADYSQIELRILAHCADDAILIDAFKNDQDIHARTAMEVFGMPPDGVSQELRRQAKAINFGIIYGMSAFGLSKELGITRKMAGIYIDNYFGRYEGVRRFLDQTIAAARETKQTATMLGRIRMLPDIDSPNRNIQQFAERTAINTPIQGTAADLIKLAMIRVEAALAEEGFQAAMLLSVHDELIFEAPPEEAGALSDRVREIMESIWEMKVPLKVNVSAGDNWAEAH